MSLLLAAGHAAAWHYPLGMVYDEANLVIERENGRMTTEALLLQGAVAGILSKKAEGAFTKQLSKLSVKVNPLPGMFDTK